MAPSGFLRRPCLSLQVPPVSSAWGTGSMSLSQTTCPVGLLLAEGQVLLGLLPKTFRPRVVPGAGLFGRNDRSHNVPSQTGGTGSALPHNHGRIPRCCPSVCIPILSSGTAPGGLWHPDAGRPGAWLKFSPTLSKVLFRNCTRPAAGVS